MFKKQSYRVLIAASAPLMCVATARAALTIDFRFPDGSKGYSGVLTAGTPIPFNAWAIGTGTSGNAAEEGMQSAIFAAKSTLVTAGISGSITSFTLATGWNGSGSQAGAATNLSVDGVGDWGNASNATINLSSSHLRVRTTKSVNNPVDWGDTDSPTGSVYHDLPDGGVEFLLGTFVFTPTAVGAGFSLTYVPVTVLGGTPVPAGWFEDTADKTQGSPTGARSPSSGTFAPATPNSGNFNGVSFNVIPEPTSLSLLGLGAMAVMRRRRDRV